MELPTPNTVDAWHDANLFAAAGFHAATREARTGFESLNEAERVLCCLFLLDNEVNNGGFGQWLFNPHPSVLGHTAWACERVGANSTARLVNEVLSPLEHPSSFTDTDAWRDYLHGLSEQLHARFEGYSHPFVGVEPELPKCSYRFARQHWAEVRTVVVK
jgi:hypothetical protein